MLDSARQQPPMGGQKLEALPTRIITYAWGEKYIDELLSFTLPAALAPGNLPYVASVAPCEMVILTQESQFVRIMNEPVIARVRELCPVRLIGLDDLIVAPDKYGMALTYALHRGFADLGPAMTDSWLIFLNADFVLADGSWRTLLGHLARGARLVASPSYCVETTMVVPQLRQLMDSSGRTLSVQPRDMAGMILKHRHNTIRGKTANQKVFSMKYVDQFYWEVNDSTLIGHQMPIAIVGMRPERYLSEPNSYWDHGFMWELCPDTEASVIGDSDDFLLMELREKDVAADQTIIGWPPAKTIGELMVLWVTPYQRDMGKYPLTLHSAELPGNLEEARGKLAAFRDEILSHAPSVLPSHLNHPQWGYHLRPFQQARHRFLSDRLGSATEMAPPPESMSELDKIWWRLDGMEKQLHRPQDSFSALAKQRRATVQGAIDQVDKMMTERLNHVDKQGEAELLKLDLDSLEVQVAHDASQTQSATPYANVRTPAGSMADAQVAPAPQQGPRILRIDEDHAALLRLQRRKDLLLRIVQLIDQQEQRFVQAQKLDYEATRRRLQLDYEKRLPPVETAAPPRVSAQSGPIPGLVTYQDTTRGVAEKFYHRAFGRVPRVTRFHPYWVAFRHLVRIVDSCAERGAKDVLAVVGRSDVATTIADSLPGQHAKITMPELQGGILIKALDQEARYDLCIFTMEISEAQEFMSVVALVLPYMRQGGKIVGFFANLGLGASRPSEQILREWRRAGTVRCAGSASSAKLVRRLNRLTVPGFSLRRYAMNLMLMAPLIRWTNGKEASRSDDHATAVTGPCISITVEISV